MHGFYTCLIYIFSSFASMTGFNSDNPLQQKIVLLEEQFQGIHADRRKELQELADIIKNQLIQQDSSKVIFVCTHNSRRSQLAEIWLRVAVEHYGLTNIESYSGGTETTAFNPRMVHALKEFGFELEEIQSGENPRYRVELQKDKGDKNVMFSKKYNDPYNPQKDFIAVMVCDQADAACPFVPGAFARVSLPYKDPKAFDNTDLEEFAYDQKVQEIGCEILFLCKFLKNLM